MSYVNDLIIGAIFIAVAVLVLWLFKGKRIYLKALLISAFFAVVTSALGSRFILLFEECHLRQWMTQLYNSLASTSMGLVILPFIKYSDTFSVHDAYNSKGIAIAYHSLTFIFIWLMYFIVLFVLILLVSLLWRRHKTAAKTAENKA